MEHGFNGLDTDEIKINPCSIHQIRVPFKTTLV
jgi:hypothetical protein